MFLRESSGTGNVVTGNFTSKVVLKVLHMCSRMPPKDAFGKRLGLADWRK